MAKKKSVRAELGELHSELKQSGEAAADRAEPSSQTGADQIFADLQTGLAKASEEAEELVVAHPLAAVAAAFLLGLLAGRILGR